ncbi:TPA: hypothetical protein U2T46_002977 [Burkholderia cenocepacia]|nr:hypothetical protein [Burkholderia cenocepacia]
MTFTFPSEEGRERKTVVLDETLDISVRSHKDALSTQSKATIEVANLSKSVREKLLSNNNAYAKRKRQEGQLPGTAIDVEVKAGYAEPAGAGPVLNRQKGEPLSTVFTGQIALVDPIDGPPDTRVRITCYTRQIDKSAWIQRTPPSVGTYRDFVLYVNRELGLPSDPIVDSVLSEQQAPQNFMQSVIRKDALVATLAAVDSNRVTAYIDDDRLVFKDIFKVLDVENRPTLTEFIGMPMWSEWGVRFTHMFDASIKIGGGAILRSAMNPQVNGSDYVVASIDYDLTSRKGPFYVSASVMPAA